MYKFNKVVLISAVTIVIAFGLIGCGGAATTTTNTTTKPADMANTATKPAETNTVTKPADAKPAVDKVGVAECDEYIEKYEACLLDKVPEAQRAMLKAPFEAQRKGFKDAAATPQGKSALAGTCKQMIESAKATTGAFGCKW